jgi:UDP-2,4-diacetamido-2,4,6-trideoxy-beta-L-altropyranose hydrolase
MIINHNLGAKRSRYKESDKVTIIPPLLREAFRKAEKKRCKKSGILLALGGSDASGIGLKILKRVGVLPIEIYTTQANAHLSKLKRYVFTHRNLSLHIDEEIAEAMACASFGIITPSTIAYEAIFMQLDFIALQVAKNQNELVKYLKKRRYTILQKRELYKIGRILHGRKTQKSLRRGTRYR